MSPLSKGKADETFVPPSVPTLTLAPYESALTVKAYIEPVAVGETLPDMPLFLEPNGCIMVPLEAMCNAAFASALGARCWKRPPDFFLLSTLASRNSPSIFLVFSGVFEQSLLRVLACVRRMGVNAGRSDHA